MHQFTRFLFLLALLLFCAALAASCKKETAPVVTGPFRLAYAKGFKIEYLAGGCKLVTDGDGRKLVLCPRGRKPPAAHRELPVIYTPVRRVVILSASEAALLRPLGELDSVVGVGTAEKDWTIEEMKKGLREGRIVYLGETTAIDYERLVALKPDVVFSYTRIMGADETVAKLRGLGVPVAVANEWLEEDPLGRLEWVKFLGAFYNKEGQAGTFFRAAEEQVRAVTEKVQGLERPKVAWGNVFMGKVYVPRGDSYAARAIAMAGGDYVFKDLRGGGGSAQITPEEFYARAKEADVLIYASSPKYGATSIAKVVEEAPLWADLAPVKAGRVYCFTAEYWQALDETAVQLADLAAIFHPDAFAGHKLRYFLKLPRE